MYNKNATMTSFYILVYINNYLYANFCCEVWEQKYTKEYRYFFHLQLLLCALTKGKQNLPLIACICVIAIDFSYPFVLFCCTSVIIRPRRDAQISLYNITLS